MVTLVGNGISVFVVLVLLGIAIMKWRIFQYRRQILWAIQNALKDRKAFLGGILTAAVYLVVFVILGGKGGRLHYMFGRIIWNTTPGEILTGLLLAMLVMISMALFVFGVSVMGAKQSGRKSGIGFFGSLLALLAAFCP